VVQWYSKVLSSIHSTKNRERQKKKERKEYQKNHSGSLQYNCSVVFKCPGHKNQEKKKTTKKMIHMERDNQVHHTILELDTFVLKEFLGKLMKWNGI
jgi:nucleosome binding factor SPN SPT16 subunit